jgi:hypothetical protein
MTPLILKRAPIGDNQDDYDVLENGVVVRRGARGCGRAGTTAISSAQHTATRHHARLRCALASSCAREAVREEKAPRALLCADGAQVRDEAREAPRRLITGKQTHVPEAEQPSFGGSATRHRNGCFLYF